MRPRHAEILSSRRPGVHSVTELVQLTGQLGHVTGYTTGQGRHEVHLRVDRIAWEEAWELLRSALAWHGLLGAATVHLQISGEEPPQILWPPS